MAAPPAFEAFGKTMDYFSYCNFVAVIRRYNDKTKQLHIISIYRLPDSRDLPYPISLAPVRRRAGTE